MSLCYFGRLRNYGILEFCACILLQHLLNQRQLHIQDMAPHHTIQQHTYLIEYQEINCLDQGT